MDKTNEKPIPLLNVTELSAWLKIKESTIRKWVCYRRVPFIHVGRAVRFQKSEIDAWLEQRKAERDQRFML